MQRGYRRGMRLAKFLKETGISQGAFADAIGVKQPTVSRYASGKKRPSLRVLRRITVATSGAVTIDDFPQLAKFVESVARFREEAASHR
jgi:transcriptional regulator with XRE-family HTH domain